MCTDFLLLIRVSSFAAVGFHGRARLELQYLIDPVFELRYSRVHARLIGLGAPDTPRYDAGQQPSFVRPLDYHRTAGIAL